MSKYKVTIDIEVGEQEGFEDYDIILMIEKMISRGVSETHLLHQKMIIDNTVNDKWTDINYEIMDGLNKAVIVKNDTINECSI